MRKARTAKAFKGSHAASHPSWQNLTFEPYTVLGALHYCMKRVELPSLDDESGRRG